MGTVTITEKVLLSRELTTKFADSVVEVPPDMRHSMADVLRDSVPEEISNEHLGYAVSAVCSGLIRMSMVALLEGQDPSTLIAPRLLALLSSASEEFITDAELSGVL